MQPVTRATVESFYQAYTTRDPARIAPLLDDDIDWMLSGPVDIMRYCGQRHGRAEVLDIFQGGTPLTFKRMTFETQNILIDGDRAAMLGMLTAVVARTGQKVRYRIAHFMRFRDGKMIEFRGIIDSFDAAEQILGHPIDVSKHGSFDSLQSLDDDLHLIAVSG
jgi:ketosteroid isomerase-like protein